MSPSQGTVRSSLTQPRQPWCITGTSLFSPVARPGPISIARLPNTGWDWGLAKGLGLTPYSRGAPAPTPTLPNPLLRVQKKEGTLCCALLTRAFDMGDPLCFSAVIELGQILQRVVRLTDRV